MTNKTFVMAESGLPVSLDPLDADYSNNLHASQMVHRSILEVDGENILQSSLLENFSYAPETREIVFTLKPNQIFNDGSPITIQDLELSIKRMLLKRPTFPVIRHIQGVEEWTKTKTPLAQKIAGITSAGNSLHIQLAKDVRTPLFRFALPIFGVVKSECVDLEKNTLSKNCATSGYYQLESTKNDTLHFKLNPKVNQSGQPLPEAISIRYIPRSLTSADLREMKDGNFVALTQEYSVAGFDEDSLHKSGFARLEQPNSRFSFFMFNPGHPAFKNENCRRLFADALRAKILADSPLVQKENSIFARILPGYMSREELANEIPSNAESEIQCKSIFKGKTIRWMPSENNNSDAFEKALKETAANFGMTVDIAEARTTKERYEDFAQGRLDIILAGSGFWAFDPIGDVQMLFTRGLHKPLSFAAADDRLQELLLGLEFLPDPNQRMRKINTHLYKHALFNVYAHAKRVYFIKGKEVNKRIPIAITPPAPWQVFNVAGS